MFGQNEIEKRIDGDGHRLEVKEIFYTLQGEGPFAGRCAVFIRLAGCHLACTFCDTEFEAGTEQNVDDVVAKTMSLDPWRDTDHRSIIVLTGGEPTRQPIDTLVRKLQAEGYHRIQIETAGSFWRDCMGTYGVHTVVSPKNGFVHPKVAENATCFKYVIDHRHTLDVDGLPICNTQGRDAETPLAKPPAGMPVYLSPLDPYNALHLAKNKKLVGELALKHHYIAGIQLHKELGNLP